MLNMQIFLTVTVFMLSGCEISQTWSAPNAVNQTLPVFDPNAININGTESDELYIHAFDANQREVRIGDPIVVTWFAPLATNVYIVGTAYNLQPSGNLTIWPSKTDTYQLVAQRQMPNGKTIQVNRFLTIFAEKVLGPPTIWLFRPDKSPVHPNELTLLRWRAAGCTQVRITGPLGFDTTRDCITDEDTIPINTPESARYTLELHNSNGNITTLGETFLEVVPEVVSPIIVRFDLADPSRQLIDSGSEITIVWDTAQATQVKLNNDPSFFGSLPDLNQLPASGQIVAHPTQDTTYVLSAFHGNLMTTREVRIRVMSGPVINEFAANPPHIASNGQSTIMWNTQNCSTAQLVGPLATIDVNCNGSQSVQLTQNTSYTLRITSATGSIVTKSFVILVDSPPMNATIDSFQTTATRIQLGSTVNLSWHTTNAARVEMLGLTTPSVELSGTIKIQPQQTMTLTLQAYDAGQSTPTKSWPLTIEVYQPNLKVSEFKASKTLVPVNGSVLLSWDISDCRRITIQDLKDSVHPLRLDTTTACSGTLTVPVHKGAMFKLEVTGADNQTTSREITVLAGQDNTDGLFNMLSND